MLIDLRALVDFVNSHQRSCRCVLIVAALCSVITASTVDSAAPSRSEQDPAAVQNTKPKKSTLLIVPHTHWEGAVFKTREEYLQIGLPNILVALKLLQQHPEYRFVLDQVCYVKPFLEKYPDQEPIFRKLLTEGRLQIAGATDVMNDNNMPSGESIARQYLLGKQYFKNKLGYDVKTGWAIDTFGHNAQMPQILRLAGLQSYWFSRGVPNENA